MIQLGLKPESSHVMCQSGCFVMVLLGHRHCHPRVTMMIFMTMALTTLYMKPYSVQSPTSHRQWSIICERGMRIKGTNRFEAFRRVPPAHIHKNGLAVGRKKATVLHHMGLSAGLLPTRQLAAYRASGLRHREEEQSLLWLTPVCVTSQL